MKNIYQVLRKPCLTEKGMALQADCNQVVLRVHKQANKKEIKTAVETVFDVKVEKVRTANVSGQSRRIGRNIGTTSSWKKAYVTLSSDSKLNFLDDL